MNTFQKILFVIILSIFQTSIQAQLKVSEVKFSVQRGFFSSPFSVSLSTATMDAVIKYTLDGSSPLSAKGITYTTALNISNTTILRVVASKANFTSSDIITQTYIFLESVLKQPINPAGFPVDWKKASGSSVKGDYEMDPEYPESDALILKSLKSLPTVSIVADPIDFFGPQGFHNNGDKNDNSLWERPGSVEFIFGDSTVNYQVNAGIQPRANGITSALKRGLRVEFKSEYGPSKLDFPLFNHALQSSADASGKYETLIMRPGNMENYTSGYNPFLNIFIRDPMIRDLQLNISGYGTRNIFAHMYFNGLYWGVYNITEQVEPYMCKEYFGGKEDDWFMTKACSKDHETGCEEAGSPNRFLEFMDIIDKADFTKPDVYVNIQKYLDVQAFVDYMIIYNFWGIGDWPDNNWIFVINNGEEPIPGRFFSWDAEKTLLQGDDPQSYKHAWYSPYLTDPNIWGGKAYISPASRVWRSLIKNSDFRMLFADRSNQLMSNNGRLTDANMIAWFDKYNSIAKEPILAEQKRWSDDNRRSKSPGRIFTYADVQAEINKVKLNIVNNVSKYKTAFTPSKLYPTTEPPKYSQNGGKVQSGFTLSITNPNTSGIIYYTTDCSDPRLSGGAVSPTAIQGNSIIQLAIQKTITVKARTLKNGEWSPINVATFLTSPNSNGLILTEIMYNPESLGDADGDNFEFIELKNSGTEDLNLSQYAFTEGIEYQFPDESIIKPNQFVVLAKDAIKFKKKYNTTPNGVFNGNLSNGGDSLVLKDPFNNSVLAMKYDDILPWPLDADSGKYSLASVNVNSNPFPDKPSSWRLSHRIGGTPGKDDLVYEPQDYSGLIVTEIMYKPIETVIDEGDLCEFIELKNVGNKTINLVGVHFGEGIEYTFYNDKYIKPNEFIVLVKDKPSFFKRYNFYGDGEYEKNLSNDGERIVLYSPQYYDLFYTDYKISDLWPAKANIGGYSLVSKQFNENRYPNDPFSWRTSLELNGSPGRDDILASGLNKELFNDNKLKLRNFPNPFTNSTTISFNLGENSEVRLQIYNQSGQLIEELLHQQMVNGEHNIEWNTSGNAPGIYIIKLQTNKSMVMGKCTLMR